LPTKKSTKIKEVTEKIDDFWEINAMKCDVSSGFRTQMGLEISAAMELREGLSVVLGKIKRAIANQVRHSSEPKVWERQDRQGNVYYQVYDPLSRRSATFGSETEIRYWLEQRYAR
jgi:hypothetical protein